MGLNDIGIIVGIMTVFIATGLILPFINDELDGNQEFTADIEGLKTQVGQDSNDLKFTSGINAFSVFTSIISMFFWSFGALPFWLDSIFVILRITLVATIARNVWIGGGS